jgi:hypothetical protein
MDVQKHSFDGTLNKLSKNLKKWSLRKHTHKMKNSKNKQNKIMWAIIIVYSIIQNNIIYAYFVE